MDVWSAERVLASAAVVGEGPVWDAGELLYWVDIERGEVHVSGRQPTRFRG